MRKTRLGLITGLPWLILGATLTAGCGDDASAPDPEPVEGGVQDETAEDEATEDEVTEDEATEDEASDEATEDESTEDEATEDEATEDEATEDEVTEDEATDETSDDVEPSDAGADGGIAVDGGDLDSDGGSTDEEGGTASDESTDESTDDETVGEPDGGIDAGSDSDAGPEPEPEPEFAAITQVSDRVLANVNDLRGLIFSADGDFIYGSGFVGTTTDVDREIAVMRFTADGTPDEGFGPGGLLTFNLVERVVAGETVENDGNEEALSLVELANGDLVVAAQTRDAAGVGTDIVLLKLDSDGVPVAGFGTDGVLRVDLGWAPADDASWPATVTGAPTDQAWDIKLDTSSGTEKLVIFAHGSAALGQLTSGNSPVQRTDTDRYILRLLAEDGALDPAFNGGAAFRFNSGGTFNDNGRRGLVLEDGTIVSSGYTNLGEGVGNHVIALQLLPNGTLDPSFNFGIAQPGVVRSNPFLDDGGQAEAYALGIQSNGRYVSTGYGAATALNFASSYGYASTTAADLVSIGFTGAGLDLSYGVSGTLAIQSEEANLGGTEDRGRDLVVLPDDRVVHAGRFAVKPAIFVTLPDGQMDLDSGTAGRFEYDALTDPPSHFFKLAASPDKSLLAASTNNHAEGVVLVVLQVGQ